MKTQHFNTRLLVEIALFSVLCVILDLFSFKAWGQGGSISLQMLPIFVIAFRHGLKAGSITGLIFGFLQLLLGAYILNPIQAFLDYPLAFMLVGSAGVFLKSIQAAISKGKNGRLIFFIFVGTLLGSLLRLIVHIISAMIYFSTGATGHQSVLAYATIYNVSYMVPSFILTTLIIMAMFSAFKRLLVTNQ